MAAIAPSVDTLVRVLRLLKVMATVFPAKAPRSVWGISPVPDLIAVLCWWALRTRVVSSAGVRSAIERRCRGANGDVAGVAGEVEDHRWARCRLRRAAVEGRRSGMLGQLVVYNLLGTIEALYSANQAPKSHTLLL